jgi:flagellar biosynthesis component FlhA
MVIGLGRGKGDSMPQIPIIVPLIVIGLVVGSTIKSKSTRISKKKLMSASLAAGLLNSVHAYLLYLLVPAQIPTRVTGTATTGTTAFEGFAATSEVPFVVASFLTALLMVLLVLGLAVVYARVGRGEELQEAAKMTPEEEAALTPS